MKTGLCMPFLHATVSYFAINKEKNEKNEKSE